MSLITFRNLTSHTLNVPRVDKEIDPQGSIIVEWADSDNLRYDEDIQDLIRKGLLEMDVPDDEKAFRPFPTYANVAAFPAAANYAEGTPIVDLSGGGTAQYLYVQVGGAWVNANPL
jgi:hypothetical protein